MSLKKKNYGLLDIISIPLQYSTGYAVIIAVLKILIGLAPTLSMIATAQFINSTISFFNHKGDFNVIIFSIILVTLCTAYSWIAPNIVEIAEAKLENNLRSNFRISLVEKVAS